MMKMKYRKRFFALLLAAAMLPVIGCSSAAENRNSAVNFVEDQEENNNNNTQDNEQNQENTDGTSNAEKLTDYSIYTAEYPKRPIYPIEEEYFTREDADYEGYEKVYQEWWNDIRARQDAIPDTLDRLDDFFTNSARQFLGSTKDNQVYSPINIYMALAMLGELAGGESREQILQFLGEENIETLRDQTSKIWNALYNDDGRSTTILGSSVWLDNDRQYNEETMKNLADHYYASSFSGEMGSEEFNKAIQAWLNEQTHGLLTESANRVKLSPLTVLALATTIYYKAPWLSQFEENLTENKTFHSPDGDIETPFMHQSLHTEYYTEDGFSAISLDLASGEMWLLLPNEDTNVNDLITNGAAMDFILNREKSGKFGEIQLAIPKFDVSYDLDLIDGLKALGITDVFDENKSDFTPMVENAEGLTVGQAQHAARVKIDEEGCEAAAFTVMAVNELAYIEEEPTDFVLDRPFLFAVTDNLPMYSANNNLPLFMGIVNNPNYSE